MITSKIFAGLLVITIGLLYPPSASLTASQDAMSPEREQTRFSAEQDLVPVQSPEPVSEGLMQVLRTNDLVLKVTRPCQGSAGTARSKIQAGWFIASKIHLNGNEEIDLVIQPKNPCMNGANVSPFWIARPLSNNSYQLILGVIGLGLDVLNTKHDRYKDVEVSSATAVAVSTVVFRFDGQMYRKFTGKTAQTQ